MKYIQYRNNSATMPIQYGLSKTGFGSVLRYAITPIVITTEIVARIIFRNLFFFHLIHLISFYKLIIVFTIIINFFLGLEFI